MGIADAVQGVVTVLFVVVGLIVAGVFGYFYVAQRGRMRGR